MKPAERFDEIDQMIDDIRRRMYRAAKVHGNMGQAQANRVLRAAVRAARILARSIQLLANELSREEGQNR